MQITAILREVRYVQLEEHGGVPEEALNLAEKEAQIRKYTNSLHTTIERYNRIRNTTRDIEFNLINKDIEMIDDLIAKGSEEYDWHSEGKTVDYSFFISIVKFC